MRSCSIENVTDTHVNYGQFIGKGRSGSVYKLHGPEGLIARKIFTGSRAAKLLHLLFYGAPCDYIWCEAAIRAAFHRRRVLNRLVSFWFGNRLHMATTYAWGWNEEQKAWSLDTEFITGHPARLYSPFLYGQKTEIYDLLGNILPKLQEYLTKAGFVGTVWQTGFGQPCAIPNFLCVSADSECHHNRWAWIDAESGVPAIVSYDLRALFSFYVPQALKHRRILFDDLAEPTLRAYLAVHDAELRTHMDEETFAAFMQDVEALTSAQHLWMQETRLTRSLGYSRAKGLITEEEYNSYLQRPTSWYLHLFTSHLYSLPHKLWPWLKDEGPEFLKLVNPARWIRFFFVLIFSRRYRLEASCAYTRFGIDEWKKSRRITEEQAEILESELLTRDSNQYLADFGVHLSMKPLGWILRVTLIPILLFFGVTSIEISGILIVFMGTILRTLYTFVRAVEDFFLRRGIPILALLIAPIPSLGTLAYPCQMLHKARKNHLISQFIIYESCSAVAAHIPVWGGRDTLWDHRFNRLAHTIVGMSSD